MHCTFDPTPDDIRSRAGYVASTGLTLGPIGSEWGESTGFTIAERFQVNLEYQPGIRRESIGAFNDYGEGDDPNFPNNDEYVLKIDAAGNLPVYMYPDIEVPGGPGIQWTLTGWHQTILAGDIRPIDGATLLRVSPSGTYRPFPNDPPVNSVEIFDGDVNTELLGYAFAGPVGDIADGAALAAVLWEAVDVGPEEIDPAVTTGERT